MARSARDLSRLVQMAKDRFSQGQLAGARSGVEKALRLDPNFVPALQLAGIVLSELGRHCEAIPHLQRAVALAPSSVAAHLNLGKVLQLADELDDALAAFARAAELGPEIADVRLGYGSALLAAGKHLDAIDQLKEAVRLNPNSADAYYNLAKAYEQVPDRMAAAAAWSQFLRWEPNSAEAMFWMAADCQQLCLWKGYEDRLRAMRAAVEAGDPAPGMAFISLWFWDDPGLHLSCAQMEAKLHRGASPVAPVRRRLTSRPEKVRLAYVSADYLAHPVPRLMTGLLEAHDRSRFTTLAVALTPSDGSAERQCVESAADAFTELHHLRRSELMARELRERDIHIAIDLNAFTGNARSSIFTRRIAPIQVNFLGFPGTTANPEMDYIVVDPFLAAGDLAVTERVVVLPHTYQCNDRSRPAIIEPPSRVSCGLPEGVFVFSSFNQQAKITPEVFDVWMNILRKVPDSILWLLAYSENAQANLRSEAEARGVDPSRLVFARKATNEQHIARLALVDLQLDTFPYGAHTTASDLLWAGAPIVTRAGRSFPSRVCGSVLNTVGLPDLIASTWDEYEQIAVSLAKDREAVDRIKSRVAHGRTHSPLFDIAKFCHDLEQAYEEMIGIAVSGERPRDIHVRSQS